MFKGLIALRLRFRIFGYRVPKDSKPQTQSYKGFGPGLGPWGKSLGVHFVNDLRRYRTRFNAHECRKFHESRWPMLHGENLENQEN